MKIRQIFEPERFQRGDTNQRPLQPIDEAAWIWQAGKTVWAAEAQQYSSCEILGKADDPWLFLRFGLDFTANRSPLRFDVSADERFVLLLDGQVISRGPHRGTVEHWYFQSYEITGLAPGKHRLEAVVWQLGWRAPRAQLSWRGGFILKAYGKWDKLLTTGRALWRVAELHNTVPDSEVDLNLFGAGTGCTVSGTGYLSEEPDAAAWQDAVVVRPPVFGGSIASQTSGWMLFPTQRPDMLYNCCTPGRVVNETCDLAKPFTVEAHTKRDLWWNLENYFCAYPEVVTSGGRGAEIRWSWTEALRDKKGQKGNRNEWKNKKFTQVFTDTFLPDGRENAFFTSTWWRSGHWCRLEIETADEPLTVERVAIGETHYPLIADGAFSADDPALAKVGALCKRTLEMCMHEALMDCPFYEQLMYQGDTRIQLLVLSALTKDERMHRFVLDVYDYARHSGGLLQMSYPARSAQESGTYSMCWALMFGDYLMWHDDLPFLKAHAPGVRQTLMGLAAFENADGLLSAMPGWSFMDWVPGRFTEGIAPDGDVPGAVSGVNNLFYLLTLKSWAKVEAALGESILAEHWQHKAELLQRKIHEVFFDEARGMLADTVCHDSFSEHAQCLALLADAISNQDAGRVAEGLVTAEDLARTTPYFSFYLFETYRKIGRADLLKKRLDAWKNFIDWGAATAFETQCADARSDCHAWSSAPLYFYATTFAGVMPAAPGFRQVRIAPQPADLEKISAKVPSPQGLIEVDFSVSAGHVFGRVTLPGTLTGEFLWQGKSTKLVPGAQTIEL